MINKKLFFLNIKNIYLLFFIAFSVFCITAVVAVNEDEVENQVQAEHFILDDIHVKSFLFAQFNNVLAVNILDLQDSIETDLSRRYVGITKMIHMFSDDSLSVYHINIKNAEFQNKCNEVARADFLLVFFIKNLLVVTPNR